MLPAGSNRMCIFEKIEKMRPQPQSTSIANYYIGVLSNLSPESKLELISQLSQSLKQQYAQGNNSAQPLFGAYKGEESAEEIIEAIRNSRVAYRNIEPL